MSEDDITLIYLVKGSLGGAARRRNLNEAQRAGLACLVCRGTDALTINVGWVDDKPVKVHSYHLEQWRSGETTY